MIPTTLPSSRQTSKEDSSGTRGQPARLSQGDVYILRGREAGKLKGEWGFFEVIGKVAASEEMDCSCAEKGHV